MNFVNASARLLALTLALALYLFMPNGQAQPSFPTKPVRMIVPFPPGQAVDIIARLIAVELTKIWGQQVVVDNRSGGNGTPGMMAGRNALADGYTLTFAGSGTMALNPILFPSLPYDLWKDFALVHSVFVSPWLIVAHPSSPYTALKDIVEAAKKQPGKINLGYGGVPFQLAADLFAFRAGINIVFVPYKGSGPAMIDLLGGQIPLLLDTLASALPHINAGKIRAVASLSEHRTPQLPNLPTVAELGYRGFHGSGWAGLLVPKATPNEIVNKIAADVRGILNDPSIQKRFIELGVVAYSAGQKEWTEFVKTESAKWTEVVRRNPQLINR